MISFLGDLTKLLFHSFKAISEYQSKVTKHFFSSLWQATRELRALGIRSIIVGVSTRSLEQEIQEFMDAGLDDYQEKPLTSSKVISILHKINHNS
jgi:DNA-binding transcriptional regulator YbjK